MRHFFFVVECSLDTNQLVHEEPSNEEEVAAQIQQALSASHETARREPYALFKGKGVIEDNEPICIVGAEASSSIQEVGGSSCASFKHEPSNPPSSMPAKEEAQVCLHP